MIGSVTNAGALAIAVVITAACASTAGLRSEPLDAGETKFYSAPLAVVGPAARQAVLSAGLNVDTVSTPDSLTWMIIAKKGMSLFSYGELVRVVVAQTPDRAVAVRVFTKRRLATNVTATGDWSGAIFQQLDRTLAKPWRREGAGLPGAGGTAGPAWRGRSWGRRDQQRRQELAAALSLGTTHDCVFERRPEYARRPSDVRLDRALHAESPAPDEPRVPHHRHSPHRGFRPAVRDRPVRAWPLAGAAGPVRRRLGVSIHRPCLRGKASGVPERLALPLRRPALVAGEDPRTGLGERRSSGRVEHALPLARHHHVTVHDVAHDPGNKGIAARLGGEPALPFQLVECRGERFAPDA